MFLILYFTEASAIIYFFSNTSPMLPAKEGLTDLLRYKAAIAEKKVVTAI